MRKKIKGMDSIKTKLILVMILVCALPLIIAIAVSYFSSNASAKTSAEDLNSKQVSIVESEFAGLLQRNISAIQVVAATPSMREYLSDTAPAQALKHEEMVAYLQDIDRDLGDDNPTVLIAPTGQQMLRSKGQLVNVVDRDYFTETMKGSLYISDVIVSKTTGSRIIVPAVPIIANDGSTILGIISRMYDIGYLHAFLAEEADEDSHIYICDRSGAVIADSAREIPVEEELRDCSSEEFFTKAQTDGSGTYIGMVDGKKMIISYQLVELNGWVVVMERDYDATMASSTRTSLIIVLVGLVMLAAAVVVALKMADSFAKPVETLNETLDAMANGEFKPIRKYADRKDEFGLMIGSANSLVDHLGSIVEQIKDSANKVMRSSAELADSAGQMENTSEDIATAVQEIATGASQQADEIQQATENTSRISENIRNVTDNAENLTRTAGHMNERSMDSASQMKALQDTTTEMSAAIDDISEKISATSEAVERISNKVASINSIASQTNLLALNASIEAARAGEAGRGFAVVAEEIGHLADDSAHTANEIRKEMEVLLTESQSTVKQAGQVRKATEQQRDVLENALESIQSLIADIDQTVVGIESIRAAADACSGSKDIVVDTMSSLSAISEQNAASAEETSASMEEMSATVTTLAGTAEELKTISDQLSEEMKFFK
ncbi:MAG: methyl-accepting chemotaxis protein [Lachnospiraceae bacterium]|nr:methyl-accepting chemotaxis protein [Lachnospiraceae bacterium]